MSPSSSDFSVTIAIPTYNRGPLLGQTLDSLASHVHHVSQLEVLVIDNRSTDQTAALAQSFTANRSGWRYLLESEQGLDHARNRAVREAQGTFLLFLDDDVLLRPGWLDAMIAPWQGPEGKQIGAIGGTVIPVYPEGCPLWLEGWATPLCFRDQAGPGPITARQMPMGANLAFRRSVFERYGLFRTDLDRKGESLLSGGESEMLKRLHRAQEAVWFAPAAVVEHQFPLTRLNLRYTSRHSFDSARSRVLEYVTDPSRRKGSRIAYCLTRPLLHLAKSIPLLAILAGTMLIGQTGSAKKALLRLSRSGGYLYQGLRSLPKTCTS